MRFVVYGNSMEPTYPSGSKIFVSKLFYKLIKPKVGDAIVLKDPRDGRLILKRVKSIKKNIFRVEGDNHRSSTDSRVFGEINKEHIIGKAILKY
ncbi:MAG: nickel-type superoxide dismutase maturation protease [Candidatus Colwellbacteria bacterium CG10_big_fil_rev_8_21_14_0_10_42_22]|uniref:Nickel-type superoxide dismutase maturation protease n=1 Tax=Candidatus Colwellbacteria bacterium CG10_big_fil_rev_8_21_14_0_10_42_22 TaxID=1974540 RepID=A0A2H0VGD6_9BACT|nr:MAG: nickel-type superoxide dismutase maturation protease [Candidatus Colwellbacteria bacterium CG10_big_fil_rev_8_21_14_0_10_42_22]